MVRATFLEKSSYFNRESRLIRLLFAYSIFKNIEILSGQGCVQIKPNSAWSIISVIECKTKRIFGVACLRKKLVFHTELFEFLEKGILKTGLFYRVKKLFKSNQVGMEYPQGR